MNLLIQVSIVILTIQCCDIVCRPHQFKHGIQKSFHFEIIPLPFKQFSFVLEKLIPFGKFEFKHDIHKRQIAESEISPISNEIPVANVAIEEINKTPPIEVLDKKEENMTPKVIMTSIIEPVEDRKSFSLIAPVESGVVITEKSGSIIKHSSSEVLITEKVIPKPEEVVPPPGPVVEITPKPLEVPPPVEQPVVQNVVVSTPIESTVPPLSNIPIISPVLNNIPVIPLLHTDITKIPLSGVPYPTPSPVPIPAVIISPPPPPPPPVKEPPVVKEETPNIFVKGSRFVLYFGSMMLQMLTQLVNGRINLNQPLPAVLPEIQ